ncbi:MAG: phosphatidate cytidylyltransferase [Deltaproteobacteria bacterium]|nr:phosphatidate cytidylyltransferase [Deltaproteobacteria bacterium]
MSADDSQTVRPGSVAGEVSSAEPVHPRPPTPLPDEPPKKQRDDLVRRVPTAAVLALGVGYIIVIGGYPYVATVLLIGILGQLEFYRLIEDKGARPLTGLGLGFGAAVIAVAYLGTDYLAMLLMTASLLFLMVAQLRKAQITESLASISGTFFGVFYVAWLLSHAVLLRFFYTSAGAWFDSGQLLALELHPESGIFFMFYGMAVLVLCDTGAYFAGRAWGRRKLAPEISPNKTIEGALGGLVTGTLGGLACKAAFDLFWPHLSAAFPWEAAIPIGIVISVVGIVGDLVESLLKRDAQVKDTGQLLPGMGGILDRADAPLLGLPVLYYLLLGYAFMRVG